MLKRYLSFYWTLIKFRLNREAIYSVNFWTFLITDIAVFVIQVAVFSVIFLQVDTFNGWNVYQMIFFVGTFNIIDSLRMTTYFFGVLDLPNQIRTGKMDLYITKPINSKFYVTMSNFNFSSVFNLFPGLIMITYSLINLDVKITLFKVVGYIILLMMMLLLYYSLMLLARTLAFWFTRVETFSEMEVALSDFAYRIPGVAYTGFSKLVFYVLLPYGLISTIPTQFFTDVLSPGYWLLTVGVCTFFWLASSWLWKKGIKHYSSASS